MRWMETSCRSLRWPRTLPGYSGGSGTGLCHPMADRSLESEGLTVHITLVTVPDQAHDAQLRLGQCLLQEGSPV